MIATKVTCDQCQAEKREVNHWLVAVEENGYLGLSIWPQQSEASGAKHLCGRACLQKWVEAWAQRAQAA